MPKRHDNFMQVTTESIIKMLPFEQSFKDNLLAGWADLSSDQKFSITQTLWSAYADVYDIAFDKNLHLELLKVQEGQGKLDEGLYQRIKEQTEQELQQTGEQQESSADLSTTREALDKILKTDTSSE